MLRQSTILPLVFAIVFLCGLYAIRRIYPQQQLLPFALSLLKSLLVKLQHVLPIKHRLSRNSLWLRSGVKVYGWQSFVALAVLRWIGRERIRKYKTSYSFVWVFGVGVLYFITAELLHRLFSNTEVIGVPIISPDLLASAWSVAASLISVSFIVIIFLLQYVENEYHNRAITQNFIGNTYIIPTVYLSLLSLGIIGWILLETSSTSDSVSVSQYGSLLSIITIVGLLISIGIVYYKITIEMFQNPLDTGLEAELNTEIFRHLRADMHREVAHKMLNDIEIKSEGKGYRGGDDTFSNFIKHVDRKSTQVITDNHSSGESQTLATGSEGYSIVYEELPDRPENFIADINIAALKSNLTPIYQYEDHIFVDLESKVTSYNDNLSIAILDFDRDSVSYKLPSITSAITMTSEKSWRYAIDDFMDDYRNIITEAVEDGEISTVGRYLETTDQLTIKVIEEYDDIIESQLSPSRRNRIGVEAVSDLAETYSHLYMKLSSTRNYDETLEVHNSVVDKVTTALDREHTVLAEKFLETFEQYYDRHRDEVHHRSLNRLSSDVSRILDRCVKIRHSDQYLDPIQDGVWLKASELAFRLLIRSSHSTRGPQKFSSLWNEIYTKNRVKGHSTSITSRDDITPLIWYIAIGYLYHCWQTNHIDESDFWAALMDTVFACNLDFESAAILYLRGTQYFEDRSTTIDFAGIATEGDDGPSLHQELEHSDLLLNAFLVTASIQLTKGGNLDGTVVSQFHEEAARPVMDRLAEEEDILPEPDHRQTFQNNGEKSATTLLREFVEDNLSANVLESIIGKEAYEHNSE